MKTKNIKCPTLDKQFTNKIIDSIGWIKRVDKMTYKDMADYMIFHYPAENVFKIGNEGCAVLDRIINILFELQDKEDIKNRKCSCKCS